MPGGKKNYLELDKTVFLSSSGACTPKPSAEEEGLSRRGELLFLTSPASLQWSGGRGASLTGSTDKLPSVTILT